MRLKDSVAVVTGAGRGIGKAIAVSLAEEGAHVVLVSRSGKELETVRIGIEKRGWTAEVAAADITDDAAAARVFEDTAKRHGRIDILVNNAGIGRFAPIRSLAMRDLDDMWKLNVRALVHCTKLALPIMEKNKRGVIVNISSLAGKNAFIGGAGYAATKWALLGLSRCLMLEEREHNIRVVAICPGSVDTTFNDNRDPEKRQRILSPQDVAEAVLLAVTMPERAMVSEIDIRPTKP
ncbi:MAG TPA: SDR family NAD(P)-dependent oxidoreductase [Bacteroidota bacterium]|nr:SDR family NAD(P)-dependent oxidoreductase [Bacteroidota bacterium]